MSAFILDVEVQEQLDTIVQIVSCYPLRLPQALTWFATNGPAHMRDLDDMVELLQRDPRLLITSGELLIDDLIHTLQIAPECIAPVLEVVSAEGKGLRTE